MLIFIIERVAILLAGVAVGAYWCYTGPKEPVPGGGPGGGTT